jgi:TonB-dependent receptor
MGDVTFGKWRFVGGARVERSIQQVTTFEPFKESVPTVNANLDNTDWLPSIGAVYAINQSMNLRAGFSRTISRPQFRELSPFEFTDVTGGRSSVGNPNLDRTLITNYDVRYEWYFSPSELFAASYFYKDLDAPIEAVVEPGANIRTSFRNAAMARNQGVELELRKGLGVLWSRFETTSLALNYTFVDSTVEIGEQDLSIVTSLVRPLVGQSRHVININLAHEVPRWDFDARVFFNYQGERLTDVGSLGLPDIVEKGFPSLDLRFSKRFGFGEGRKPWSVDFEMENLLNRQHSERQGNQIFREYRSGRDYSIGVSYNFF